jgi:hypothetical protein
MSTSGGTRGIPPRGGNDGAAADPAGPAVGRGIPVGVGPADGLGVTVAVAEADGAVAEADGAGGEAVGTGVAVGAGLGLGQPVTSNAALALVSATGEPRASMNA